LALQFRQHQDREHLHRGPGYHGKSKQADNELLARIEAPHFTACLVLKADVVVIAADIVRFMGGWPRDRVRDYCHQKGWRITAVAQQCATKRAR
jgi:hypothetical protein